MATTMVTAEAMPSGQRNSGVQLMSGGQYPKDAPCP
jgi:hypothetical protein